MLIFGFFIQDFLTHFPLSLFFLPTYEIEATSEKISDKETKNMHTEEVCLKSDRQMPYFTWLI